MKIAVVLASLAALLLRLPPSFAVVPTPSVAPVSDPEMKRIYDADQADRSGYLTKIDWAVVGPRDAERRQETRRLLAEGRLHTGADFLEAAFVFQHGAGDDFLLAHALALVATKKGDPGGPWIAAATLDRYLQNVGRKQIYGTQTSLRVVGWSKEPYDRNLISDSLRHELAVPDLATQAIKLEQRKAQENPLAVVVPTAAPQVAPSGEINCDNGPINRVYVRATWRINSCDNGILLGTEGGKPTATIIVNVLDGIVFVTPQGSGDDAEVKVATAAFQAMTSSQIADIVDQTKSVPPSKTQDRR